ncbi:MAG TPA: hypothetical protein EYQ74_15080 [Planctomycetes bacterium]|nr:hypothetical protein [Planctomycetota bacterium]HIK62338.1 hypothetical protein [Planctomycetota bacterium]
MVRAPNSRTLIAAATVLVIAGFGISTLVNDRALNEERSAQLIEQLPFYPMNTCVVSGEGLSFGTLVIEFYEDHLVLLANESARQIFLSDPRTYWDVLRQEAIRSQAEAYPTASCVVSKELLGAMGPTINHLHGMQLVLLCCSSCVSKLNKTPGPYLETLNEAYFQAGREAANDTTGFCPVTGTALGEKAVEVLWGTRLVRLADESAKLVFLGDPWRYALELR